MRTCRYWARMAICAIAIGCHGGLSLDASSDLTDDGFEAIRRRLAITIESGPTGFTQIGSCSTTDCSPEAFRVAIRDTHCEAITSLVGRTSGAGNDCAARVIEAEKHVCAAQTLLSVIDSPSTSEIIAEAPSDTVRVPPQDAESNSELARLALDEAESALRTVADAFDAARVPGCTNALLDDDAGSTAPLETLSLAEELAYFFSEAVDVARAAGERMAEAGAAVSDAAYSRRSDNAEASRDALAPFASRTAAAHMLVGGQLGLPALEGVSSEGFFTRSGLSGEAQRAIELIRAAAIDPALLLSTAVSIDELVVGAGSVSAANSIRFRLGHNVSAPV